MDETLPKDQGTPLEDRSLATRTLWRMKRGEECDRFDRWCLVDIQGDSIVIMPLRGGETRSEALAAYRQRRTQARRTGRRDQQKRLAGEE